MSDVIYEATFTDLDLFREQTGPLQMETIQLENGRFCAHQHLFNLGEISF